MLIATIRSIAFSAVVILLTPLAFSQSMATSEITEEDCRALNREFRSAMTLVGTFCENAVNQISVNMRTKEVSIKGQYAGDINASGMFVPADGTEAGGGDKPAEKPGYMAQIEACERAAEKTASDCSAEKSDDAMSSAMASIDAATNAINAGGGAYACGQVNSAAQAANAAMVGVKAMCSASFSSCQSACSKNPVPKPASNLPNGLPGVAQLNKLIDMANERLELDRKRFAAARNRCYSASQRVANIDQNIAQLQAAQARAGQCQADAAAQAALANGGSGLSAQCRLNPNLPICSGASAAVPPVSSNRGQVASGSSASSSRGGLDGGPGGGLEDIVGNFAGDSGFGTGGVVEDPNAQAANAGSGLPSPVGGGPGGSGKGANKAEAPGQGTKVASKFNPNILGGSYSGRFGSFTVESESGKYNPNGSWIPPKVGPHSSANINLDKFRPNMKGYRQPTTEGSHRELLGAHVNIWKQMNLRYDSLSKSLMP